MDQNSKTAQWVSISIIVASIIISGTILYTNVNKSGGGANNNTNNTNTDQLSKLALIAESMGLNGKDFKQCVSSETHKGEIANDQQAATAAGITGTPSFVIGKSTADGNIDGRLVVGAVPYTDFKAVIDALLAGKPAPAQPATVASKTSIDDDAVLGSANAPMTMVEFSDYECPFCKRHFTDVYPQIKKDYVDTGKLKLVFRDFIAVSSHNPAATVEALAAECAGQMGGDEAYYKFHDQLFTKTKSNGLGI